MFYMITLTKVSTYFLVYEYSSIQKCNLLLKTDISKTAFRGSTTFTTQNMLKLNQYLKCQWAWKYRKFIIYLC